MSELSVDQTNAALVKAQAEVLRSLKQWTEAKAEVSRAQGEVTRAQAGENETAAQIGATATTLTLLDAQARNVDPGNDPALRRLSAERLTVETRQLAWEGRRQREQEQREKVRADA